MSSGPSTLLDKLHDALATIIGERCGLGIFRLFFLRFLYPAGYQVGDPVGQGAAICLGELFGSFLEVRVYADIEKFCLGHANFL